MLYHEPLHLGLFLRTVSKVIMLGLEHRESVSSPDIPESLKEEEEKEEGKKKKAQFKLSSSK